MICREFFRIARDSCLEYCLEQKIEKRAVWRKQIREKVLKAEHKLSAWTYDVTSICLFQCSQIPLLSPSRGWFLEKKNPYPKISELHLGLQYRNVVLVSCNKDFQLPINCPSEHPGFP